MSSAATVVAEPTDAMMTAGAHALSEWFNDNAPIGEDLYRLPARAAWKAMRAADPRVWPAQLTTDLRDILGFMCFELGRMAHAYQHVGEFVGAEGELRKRAEDEQAFMLHKLLGLWLEHGDGWREAATTELERVVAKAKAKSGKGL